MKYTVVGHPDPIKFQLSVNEYLSKGWKLVGGVCVDTQFNSDEIRTTYYQAMVKYNPPKVLPILPEGERWEITHAGGHPSEQMGEKDFIGW